MRLEEEFKKASETGRSVIILKSISECDCFDREDLLNSEPEPHCPKCFGTGRERLIITTEKIRYDYSSQTQSVEKTQDVAYSTEDQFTFFMPEIYGTLTNEDLIVTTDSNYKFFEIVNKFEFTYHDFSYFEFTGKKIPFLSGFVYE